MEILILLTLFACCGIFYTLNYIKSEIFQKKALLLKELDKFLKEELKDNDTEIIRQEKIKKFKQDNDLNDNLYNILVQYYKKHSTQPKLHEQLNNQKKSSPFLD